MFNFSVEITNEKTLDDYLYVMERAPLLMTVLMQKVGAKYDNLLKAALQKPVGPVVYPIQWTSPLQQEAFFATNGFGNGIPYTRTDDLLNAWHTEVIEATAADPAAIAVTNDDPKEPFVMGQWQQQFHIVTGWQNEADILLPIQEEMANEVDDLVVQAFDDIEQRGFI